MRTTQALVCVLKTLVIVSALLITACASDSSPYNTGSSSLAGKIKACRTGDQKIADSSQCLQDDAACYQLANGNWCTGPRGNQCPAGSTEIPANGACPTSTRCFTVGESKRCAISFQ